MDSSSVRCSKDHAVSSFPSPVAPCVAGHAASFGFGFFVDAGTVVYHPANAPIFLKNREGNQILESEKSNERKKKIYIYSAIQQSHEADTAGDGAGVLIDVQDKPFRSSVGIGSHPFERYPHRDSFGTIQCVVKIVRKRS